MSRWAIPDVLKWILLKVGLLPLQEQYIQCLPFGISCHNFEANRIYKARLQPTEESITYFIYASNMTQTSYIYFFPIYPQNELSMVAQRFDLSNRSAGPQKNDLVSFLFKVISFQNPSNLTISIVALSVHLERIWRSRNYHSIFCLLNFEWEGI